MDLRPCGNKVLLQERQNQINIFFSPVPICWFLTWFYWHTSSNSTLCLQYEVESPSLQGFKGSVDVALGSVGRKVGLDL